LETNNVTSRGYIQANMTNIVMQMHWGEESQPEMEGGCGVPNSGGWRGRKRTHTVTFPWWVPNTEHITSEISPIVA